MELLMSYNTQDLKFKEPVFQRVQNGMNCDLKQSNSQIFPSLHPLGKLYREKSKAPPPPVFDSRKNLKLPDPVKKVKTNDHSELIASKIEKLDSYKDYAEKTFRSAIQYEFTVPKLPTRLCVTKKSEIIPSKTHRDTSNIESNQMTKEPLILPESSFKNFKEVQKHLADAELNKSKDSKDLHPEDQINSEVLYKNKDQDEGENEYPFDNAIINFLYLESLYQRYEAEFLLIQLGQNVTNLLEISKKEQRQVSSDSRLKNLSEDQAENFNSENVVNEAVSVPDGAEVTETKQEIS